MNYLANAIRTKCHYLLVAVSAVGEVAVPTLVMDSVHLILNRSQIPRVKCGHLFFFIYSCNFGISSIISLSFSPFSLNLLHKSSTKTLNPPKSSKRTVTDDILQTSVVHQRNQDVNYYALFDYNKPYRLDSLFYNHNHNIILCISHDLIMVSIGARVDTLYDLCHHHPFRIVWFICQILWLAIRTLYTLFLDLRAIWLRAMNRPYNFNLDLEDHFCESQSSIFHLPHGTAPAWVFSAWTKLTRHQSPPAALLNLLADPRPQCYPCPRCLVYTEVRGGRVCCVVKGCPRAEAALREQTGEIRYY